MKLKRWKEEGELVEAGDVSDCAADLRTAQRCRGAARAADDAPPAFGMREWAQAWHGV